jgi:hypothetical protein
MTDIPKNMRAVLLTGHGGLDQYAYRQDWPTPQAEAGEVLIKVRACGLNNTDVNTLPKTYRMQPRALHSLRPKSGMRPGAVRRFASREYRAPMCAVPSLT